MARSAKRLGRARGRGLEGHAPHHRLARHLVDHPDLDGVRRDVADDGDHRVGPAPGRQLFEAGARVAARARCRPAVDDLGFKARRDQLALEAHEGLDHDRRRVRRPHDECTLAARAAVAPNNQVDARMASASRPTRGAV